MNTYKKGDIAELAVASDLVQRGYEVAFPFTTSCDWDLILIREDKMERVQVKYAARKNGYIPVRSRTHSNTSKGQTQRTYTPGDFEWLAVYCPEENKCFYLPNFELGSSMMHLRLDPPKNNNQNVRWAKDYESL